MQVRLSTAPVYRGRRGSGTYYADGRVVRVFSAAWTGFLFLSVLIGIFAGVLIQASLK